MDITLLSVIIPTYNGLKYTKKMFKSLVKHTKVPFEVIFVDNYSQDGTAEYLKKLSEKHDYITAIFNKENFGFPVAVNQGIKMSEGDYLLIANNDIILTKKYINRLLSAFETNNNIGITAPVTNFSSGVQIDKDATYKDTDKMKKYANKIRKTKKGKGFEFPRVTLMCTLISRKVIEKIGGLDERFTPGNFEDDDFCLRSQIAGFKTYICEDVFVHHYGSKSFLKEGDHRYLELLERNRQIFVEKWGADPNEIWLQGKQVKNREIYYPINDNQVKEYFDRAKICIKESDYKIALQYMRKAIEEYSNFDSVDGIKIIDLLNFAGNIALAIGDIDIAQKYFEDELVKNPESSRACLGLGNVFVEKENFENAKAMFEWAVKNHPSNTTAVNQLFTLNKILGLPENHNSLN